MAELPEQGSGEQRCRAAGMDAYLSKPIDRAKLNACLERLLPPPGSTGATLTTQEVPIVAESGNYPLDWEALLESLDGDKEFARGLVDAYIETGDRELAAIAVALTQDDAASLRESAHTLKGASANLRALAATSAAAQLEAAAGSGENSKIPALAEKLAAEVRKTIGYLTSMAGYAAGPQKSAAVAPIHSIR